MKNPKIRQDHGGSLPTSGVRRLPKTSVVVAQALAERIARLEPGMMLPAERDMISELGVGRGTLREALRLLELQGLIRVKTGPRGGPIVLRPDHRPLADTLSLFLQTSNATFGEIVQSRGVIEAELSRRAAAHATKDQIAALYDSISAMEANLDDEEFFLEENLRFHQVCAAAARNEVLRVFHSSLKQISDGHAIGVDYNPRHVKSVIQAHRCIADAIAAGDSQAAYEAMVQHMNAFENFVQRYYPSILNRRIRWVLPGQAQDAH